MEVDQDTGEPQAISAPREAGVGHDRRRIEGRPGAGNLEQHPEAGGGERRVVDLKYIVVYERTPNNYSAYVPDLPGCVATGSTRKQVERRIREAVSFHLEGLKAVAEPLPEPSAWAETVETGV